MLISKIELISQCKNILHSLLNIGYSEYLPFSLVMSSACVLPLDIHATARDSRTPIGTATATSRKAARISYPGSSCSDMISKTEDALVQHSNPASYGCLDFAIVDQTFNIAN